MLVVFALLGLYGLAAAAPATDRVDESNSPNRRQIAGLPTIKLPYGEYQATSYDSRNDVYIWRNIRFAAPPVGNLRFAKPAPPENSTKLFDSKRTGPASGCPQILSMKLLGGVLGNMSPGLSGLVSGPNGLMSSVDTSAWMTEDCLFLDIIVPAKALKQQAKLPVINWIYGGAYILGNKDSIWDGSAVVKASQGNVIWISGNYRLGALGFLAGTTIEKDKSAIANAGFYDQRAVLEWIQKYISLFGGDAQDVTVWGESAGAGSIYHHLVAFGGKQEPLFRKAVLQSPAFTPMLDRKGSSEKKLHDFAAMAGCAGKGLECLRAADFKTIHSAQVKYVDNLPPGAFGFGPSVDGTWVRQLPPLELATGNVAKGIESLIVSHVVNEAKMFVVGTQNETTFTGYADRTFGNYSAITNAIVKKYPVPGPTTKYKNHKERQGEQIQFSSFTCHTRWIAEAYKNKTWNVQYSAGGGGHGADIAADFYGGTDMMSTMIQEMMGGGSDTRATAPTYQSYLVSHARTGNPNAQKAVKAIEWPKVRLGPTLSNVLNVGADFSLISDETNKAEDCDFWMDVLATATNLGGYAAPGAVVPGKLVNVTTNPSANFVLA